MLYRCYGCVDESGRHGRDFEGPHPHCDRCQIDAASGPRLKALVVERALVHLDPPSGIEQQGLNHAACSEAIKVGKPRHHFTAEPSAVTCAACKKTEVFRAQAADRGVPVVLSEADVPVTVDPVAKTIRPSK